MPAHPFQPERGRLVTLTVDSRAISQNLLGDPTTRRVLVYLPEGYDDEPHREYSLFVNLASYTGSGLGAASWKAFSENLPQRLDRLRHSGAMGPVVCAMPDCFTSLGGNQYVDSVAMGRWAEFLTRELVPLLERELRIGRGREHRALFGKSSGGYGALTHGMLHSDTWGAVACHSGDMAFEWVFQRDFPSTLDQLARHGGVEGFLNHLAEARKLAGSEFMALMTLAMGASYDPDPHAYKGIRLPVDHETCQLDPDRWAAWLRHDPVRMVQRPECQAGLRSLLGLFVDVGFKDQYFLHYGARQLHRALGELGIEHRYEEYSDNHSGIDYRLDESLPYLYRCLRGAERGLSSGT